MMLPIANLVRHPQGIAAAAAGTVAVAAAVIYVLLRRRLTPAQREERRRNRLAAIGRIIDGTLIDSTPESEPARALIYRYRIGGVTYECGQDVSMLLRHLPDLGPGSALLGTPVQVRYDRDNPADSIVLSETWNGLWNQNREQSEQR